jgi:hypothetical protein
LPWAILSRPFRAQENLQAPGDLGVSGGYYGVVEGFYGVVGGYYGVAGGFYKVVEGFCNLVESFCKVAVIGFRRRLLALLKSG